MKKTKLTTSDLAIRTQALEDQITRIKGRLDSLSFHKHKHRNRLKMLSGETERLNKRLGDVEHQLPTLLSMGGKRLARRFRALQKQYKALRKSPPKTAGENVPKRLKGLKSRLADLHDKQKGSLTSLQGIAEQVTSISGGTRDLRLEADQLRQQIRDLEERNEQFSALHASQESRLLDAETLLSELAAGRQDEALPQALEAEVDGLHRGLAALRKEILLVAGDKQAVDRPDVSVPASPDTGQSVGVEGPATDTDESNDSHESRLLALEGQIARLDNLLQQIEGTATGIGNDIEKRLGWVESEIIRLAEAADMLQESIRELGGQELDTHARIEALQNTLAEFTRDNSNLKNGVHSLSGELDQADSALSNRLQQVEQRLGNLDQLTESLHSHVTSLQQPQGLADREEDPSATLQQEFSGQLDRIEQAAETDRERIDQLQTDLIQVREETGSQQRLNDDAARQHQQLESRIGLLADEIRKQIEQLDGLTAKIQALPNDGNARPSQDQALTGTLDALQEKGLQSAIKLEELEAAQKELLAEFQSSHPIADAQSKAIGSLRVNLDEIARRGRQLESQLDAALATGKANRLAMAGLAALLLLGGVVLYRYGDERILANSSRLEQFIDLQSDSQQARMQLEEQIGGLRSALDDTARRIEEIPRPASGSRKGGPRGTVMEGSLATVDKGTDSATPAASHAVSALHEQISQTDQNLQRMEVQIGDLKSALDTTTRRIDELPGPAADTHEDTARLARVEAKLAAIEDGLEERVAPATEFLALSERVVQADQIIGRLDTRLSSLESTPPMVKTDEIGRDLASVQSSIAALGKRLESLERGRQQDSEWLKRLDSRVGALAEDMAQSDHPAEKNSLQISTIDWKTALEQGSYTIQLAGAYRRASLERLLDLYDLKGRATFFRTRFNQRDWYVLLYGAFDNLSSASRVLRSLPDPLKQDKPWIRRIPADGTHMP